MEKQRFSLLLLEPGEVYFEDFSSTLNDNNNDKSGNTRHGRLKLCSKSLVFEPKEWRLPLIKFYFKDCSSLSIVKSNSSDKTIDVIKITMKQYAEMLEENILAPYKFTYKEKEFFITFDFAPADECLSQMEQLKRASTLHAPEHNSMIATILHSRYMRMVFDPVMMDDFTEEILCELQAEKISPLVRHQGKLAITPTTIYFQPFSNVESSSILKVKLCHILRMYRRRFLLRQVGLELFCSEKSLIDHIYLSFRSEDDREKIYCFLEGSPNIKLERVHADEMTLQWQNGVVSNFDYLMYLNCQADRSEYDLTQYPVFPWIVADYTSDKLDLNNIDTFRDLSKPMGALNPDRLDRLKERYSEMTEPKFLYGSHYSAPGLVLFYLVRKHPRYMLCLQNGRFDHPDRMFNSVKDVYNNCLRNMSDFKELLPEFYDVSGKGDFLVNKYEIDFGERFDGSKVNDVAMPPWAASPEDFVIKLRQALESDYVSKHLHLWIDLIFGYKQRGVEAVKADNVFHHVCYEGAVDLELVYDMNDKHALEVQIMEFGQIPKQLFTKPHVRKVGHVVERPLECSERKSYNVQCVDVISLHKQAVTCALRQGSKIISVGKDGTLKVYDIIQKKQIRSVILCETPLSSCVMIEENIVAAGSWGNEIFIYDVEFGKTMESFRAHDDAVTCLLWLQKERLLVSGGSDGVVRVWADVRGAGPALKGLRAELDHDGNITMLNYRRSGREVDIITGSSDGEVCVWRLSARARLLAWRAHAAPLRACAVLAGGRLLTAGAGDGDGGGGGGGGELRVTDLSFVHTVYSRHVSEAVHACAWAGDALWAGGAAGTLAQWDLRAVALRSSTQAHQDSITSIFYDEESNTLVTSSLDKTVKLWALTQNS